MFKFAELKYQIGKYYNNNNFKFAILPFVQKREIAFLIHKDFIYQQKSMHRMKRGHNLAQITFLGSKLDYFNRGIPFNWYISVAKYKDGIPKTSTSKEDNEERLKITKKWKETHIEYIEEYDFIIDIDAPTHDDINHAVTSAKLLRSKLLDEDKKFFIVFSGCGFHFHIKNESKNKNFNKFDDKSIYSELRLQAKKYHDHVSELIDLSIYDSRRVIKIPHSLSIYKHQIYICKPISDPQQLNNFDIRNYIFNPDIVPEFHKPYIYGESYK